MHLKAKRRLRYGLLVTNKIPFKPIDLGAIISSALTAAMAPFIVTANLSLVALVPADLDPSATGSVFGLLRSNYVFHRNGLISNSLLPPQACPGTSFAAEQVRLRAAAATGFNRWRELNQSKNQEMELMEVCGVIIDQH